MMVIDLTYGMFYASRLPSTWWYCRVTWTGTKKGHYTIFRTMTNRWQRLTATWTNMHEEEKKLPMYPVLPVTPSMLISELQAIPNGCPEHKTVIKTVNGSANLEIVVEKSVGSSVCESPASNLYCTSWIVWNDLNLKGWLSPFYPEWH